MTPPVYSPWLKAFEVLARFGFTGNRPGGSPGRIGNPSLGTDCTLGEDWRNLATPRALFEAWSPPPESPWSAYARPTLFAALGGSQDPHPQQWGGVPMESAPRARNEIPDDAALILDLPGGFSVALAAWFARFGGMQPVVLFNNWPHPLGVVEMADVLGGLLYHAPWARDAQRRNITRAPPVFVLDRNRFGAPARPLQFDNRYYHQEADLPSAAAFKRAGIEHVYYVVPENLEAINPSARGIPPGGLAQAFAADLSSPAASRNVTPYVDMDDLNGTLREFRKTLGLSVVRAKTGSWELGEPQDFAPAPRKTPFNTSRDPSFAGFRRNSAGGFGKMIPQPSSGGGGFG